jgi:hypothetical protein
MILPRLTTLVLLIANAGAVFAADAWVLRGFAGPCLGLQWEADTLLLNPLPAPAVVRLVSISDGSDSIAAPDRELVVPAGQTLSLNRNTAWHQPDVPLFVLRLDVPDGVLIEGVLNLGTGSGEGCPLPPAPDSSAAYGVIHLPHFRALVPANQEQIHLGTTLGGTPRETMSASTTPQQRLRPHASLCTARATTGWSTKPPSSSPRTAPLRYRFKTRARPPAPDRYRHGSTTSP